MLIIAAVLDTGVVDIQHNVMQTGVHFLGTSSTARRSAPFQPRCHTPPALAALPSASFCARLKRKRSIKHQSWLAYLRYAAARRGNRARARRQRPVRSASRMAGIPPVRSGLLAFQIG